MIGGFIKPEVGDIIQRTFSPMDNDQEYFLVLSNHPTMIEHVVLDLTTGQQRTMIGHMNLECWRIVA